MQIKIIGAGLAGCEAALWLADHGVQVALYEQKPVKFSPAHKSAGFAELICSNSLKAERPDSASGLLKIEMRMMGSHLLDAAETARVAAGGALAVDRDVFSTAVTEMVEKNPNITVHREEVTALDESVPVLVASGPLTEGVLAEQIAALTGSHRLSFFDAVAPIVSAESLDMEKIFAASRYGRGEADYLNCPFNKLEYEAFYNELLNAERAPLHDFDGELTVYEGCMPIEVMAGRGADTMRYGPLRPVGLRDPRTGHRPWANVQLRAENTARTLYNIVGFQTNLKWGEQKRVFSMIPGLEHAEFIRYGVMHRNTFLESPAVLTKGLYLKEHPNVFFAGQITGFEGYMESAACGLLAARNIYARLEGKELPAPPIDTMCGALIQYLTTENKHFQPMGANMGILPPLPEDQRPRDKRLRYMAVAEITCPSRRRRDGEVIPQEGRKPMKIIVDMMGGDNAPLAVLEGAAAAVKEYGVQLIGVGDEALVRKTAADNNISLDGIELVNCTEVIEMCDEPARAIRTKKDSSIVVGLNMLKEGKGDAFVSAGSTGALHVGASLIVRTLRGIKRPALATMVPAKNKAYLLLDCGANVECRPEMLAAFAVMGSCYVNKVEGRTSPSVALAHTGAEESKGTPMLREAHQLLKTIPGIRFVGNIEPRDVPNGDVDVVVCDGFTGNVILKLTEGVAKMLLGMLKEMFLANLGGKIAYLLLKSGVGSLKHQMDSEEYGGAPFLGAKQPVIKAHGSSKAKGIKNAIRQANICVENDLCGTMQSALDELKPSQAD